MSNRKKAGRRERLLNRSLPTDVHQLRVEDDAAAQAELVAARGQLELAPFRPEGADEAVAAAEKRVAAARRAVEACYEPVTLRALRPKAFEALVAEHPPTEEGKAWGPTFPRALFLACAPTGEDDPSQEEWESILEDGLSHGEKEALFQRALEVNARWPSGAVPNV